MKHLLTLALLHSIPMFSQWSMSLGGEHQVYSSNRLESPRLPTVGIGYCSAKSHFAFRLPIETQSTHWSQPSCWVTLIYHRNIYDFQEIEGGPSWAKKFENTAYALGRLSFFRNQTIVEDHVAGFVDQQWRREEYTFKYENPSLGLGIGLSSKLKDTEFYAEGAFHFGSQLITTVYKGILNSNGTQSTIESYAFNEQLRFMSFSFGLRQHFSN